MFSNLAETCVWVPIFNIMWKTSNHTCDDRLIISLSNQGTQVRDNIDRTAKNVINTTNLAKKRSWMS